ncbi:MAG TPA: NmrA family NAD(P)-binding protein [Marmoricola sp.]|nr:NmrA family NAD(P)-binding protein [Marmoricola sp.]
MTPTQSVGHGRPGPRPGDLAVVGATGRQGSAVVRHALADGWRVRALTRDPSGAAARTAERLGAELHSVDLENQDSLRSAFEGAYGVFNVQNPMTSSLEAEVRHGCNVAAAAAAAGVRHVVYGAAGVANQPTGVPSWDSKLEVARCFRDLGLSLTVLRPMAFMELMTDKAFYPNVAVWQLMPKLMGSRRPVGWLCTDDLGAIAARVFADPDRWAESELSLLADVQSIDECREIWRTVVGRRPRGFPMPARLFERFVGTDLTTMWRWLSTAELELSTETTRELLPRALTVRDWLVRQRQRR